MKKKSGLLFRSNVEMRYFRQMLKKNLVIFLFVMLIVLPVSVYSCISLTRNELNNVSSAAQIAVNSVSREVQSIFGDVDALGSESDFKSVNTLSLDLELKNYPPISRLRSKLTLLTRHYPALKEIFLRFPNIKCTVTSRWATFDYADYDQTYSFDPADYDGLTGGVDHTYSVFSCDDLEVRRKDKVEEVHPISLGVNVVLPNRCRAYALISSDYVTGLLPGFLLERGTVSLSGNRGGELVRYGMDDRDEAGLGGLRMSYTDDTGLLRMDVAIPYMAVLQLNRNVILLYILYIVAAAIATICIAYRMTKRQFIPVRDLMEQIEAIDAGLPERVKQDDFIRESVARINDQRIDAVNALEHARNSLNRNAEILLLNGFAQPDEELLKNFPPAFIVVYGVIDGSYTSENASILGTVAVDRMIRYLPVKVNLDMLSHDSFAFLYPLSSAGDTEGQETLERFCAMINDNGENSIHLCHSGVYEGPGRVYNALEEARTEMLHYMKSSGKERSDPAGRHSVQFPSGVALYQTLISGDYEKAKDCLAGAMNEDMAAQYGIRSIYDYLSSVIRFAASDIGYILQEEPLVYTVHQRPTFLTEHLTEVAAHICDYRNNQKGYFVQEQRQELIAYIQSHLGNVDLSAQDLCNEFRLSERSVKSIIFSESGQTFANFIRSERIAKAAELLKQSDMQVNDICAEVGFGTVSAFRKAFKSTYGVAPLEYRTGIAEPNESKE